VFDPVSARLAAHAGFKLGLLGGSIASALVVGAPDLIVLTLTELADQVRRISRASALPLLVDADHGYGNALNVRRTVEELESAGVAALSIEDTELPQPYAGKSGVLPVEEFGDKLRAAVDARTDPALIVVGRIGALARGLDETMARVKACVAADVDAIFLVGRASIEMLDAVRTVAKQPLLIGGEPGTPDELISRGVRILMGGHPAYFAMLKGLYDAYVALRAGATAEDLAPSLLPKDLQDVALAEGDYASFRRDFLAEPS
jgi:carboxyvinyl-carboxyphosphonate phosphorylmutase